MSETRTIRIEVLFPEVACLYGDLFNVKYLASSIKDSGLEAEVISTSLKDTPAFVSGDVDMVYMGPMPEYAQELALEVLMPLKERIEELIEAGKVFLFTGNAFEIFGEYIERDDGSLIDCLGIYEGHAVRRMMKRYNSLYLGKFGEMDKIGRAHV